MPERRTLRRLKIGRGNEDRRAESMIRRIHSEAAARRERHALSADRTVADLGFWQFAEEDVGLVLLHKRSSACGIGPQPALQSFHGQVLGTISTPSKTLANGSIGVAVLGHIAEPHP